MWGALPAHRKSYILQRRSLRDARVAARRMGAHPCARRARAQQQTRTRMAWPSSRADVPGRPSTRPPLHRRAGQACNFKTKASVTMLARLALHVAVMPVAVMHVAVLQCR